MVRDIDTEIAQTNWAWGDAVQHRNAMTARLRQALKQWEPLERFHEWAEDARCKVNNLNKQRARLIARRDAA